MLEETVFEYLHSEIINYTVGEKVCLLNLSKRIKTINESKDQNQSQNNYFRIMI